MSEGYNVQFSSDCNQSPNDPETRQPNSTYRVVASRIVLQLANQRTLPSSDAPANEATSVVYANALC